jgi:hypothetical protein
MQRFGSARERREAELFFNELFGRAHPPLRARTRTFEDAEDEGESAEQTTTVLPTLTIRVTPYMVLDRYDFDVSDFQSFHRSGITRTAHLVVDGIGTSEAITEIRIVGHTDSTGPTAHNDTLGRQRAEKVAAFLRSEIDSLRPGTSSSITFIIQTVGPRQPAASNSVPANRPLNRRVQIFLDSTCRAFLSQYDLRFEPTNAIFGVPGHPQMTAAEKTLRIADVRSFVTVAPRPLVARRNARGTAAASGAAPGTVPAAAAVDPALRPAAQRLSDSQLELFREYMPDGRGGIEFDRLRTCFEGFANGELRSLRVASVAEPNGGFFFLFAEWAFLCIDSGIDAAIWTDLARIFVMGQEMLIQVYRPAAAASPPPRSLDAFRFTNFSASRQFTAAQKTTLRAAYAGIGLPAILDKARDNMRLAITMP